jgi:hypothetical protein
VRTSLEPPGRSSPAAHASQPPAVLVALLVISSAPSRGLRSHVPYKVQDGPYKVQRAAKE